jgi:hypothetical protein
MKTLELKEDFQTIVPGTVYLLPEYEVVDKQGIRRTGGKIELRFVRGSKNPDEPVERCQGTLHEHLLATMIHDLKHKNELVPSREGALVITKLQEALGWLRQRQVDRQNRAVDGTYKK